MERLLHKISFWVTLVFGLFVVGTLSIVALVIHFSNDLPDYRQLEEYDPPTISRLYSLDGRLIEEYAKEKRIYVLYNEIPETVVQAFLAAEDKNFFHHPGIDLYSIARAAVQNIFHLGRQRSVVGGSTITQQVVKNFLLTNERTMTRKLKEAILAYRISKVYSKERILELYLNQIFLGHSSYGVAAASLNYFNKELKDLTVEEAAMLAALPKAPSQMNPFRHYGRAKARRDWVIDRMLEEKFISNDEAKKATAAPIVLQTRREEFVRNAEYYAESVRSEMLRQFDEENVYTKGYTVFTYLNPKMQDIAATALRNGIRAYDHKRGFRGPLSNIGIGITEDNWQEHMHQYVPPAEADGYMVAVVISASAKEAQIGIANGDAGIIPIEQARWALSSKVKEAAGLRGILKPGDIIIVQPSKDKDIYMLDQIPAVNGGLVAMEVGTGKVLAMSGGYSFNSKFNRVTQAMRQPGSLFKPLVYLTALESGYKPNDIVLDEPITLSQGPGMAAWRPKNYGNNFLGPMTLRQALEKSRNTPTVRLAVALELKKVADTAIRLGLYKSAPSTLAVALGAYETTLLDATNAYNIIASYGQLVKPQLIDRIYDYKGRMVYSSDHSTCERCQVAPEEESPTMPIIEMQHTRIIDERRSYQMISMLEGAVKRGTAARALQLHRTVAGKTGTTNDSFDTWFIGFTPDIVVGVYVGFDTPRSLGQRETGATLALPIFIEFMQSAITDIPNRNFRVPEGIKIVQIDGNTGGAVTEDTERKRIISEAFLSQEDENQAGNIKMQGDIPLEGLEDMQPDEDNALGVVY